jgi:hypothetical protein
MFWLAYFAVDCLVLLLLLVAIISIINAYDYKLYTG